MFLILPLLIVHFNGRKLLVYAFKAYAGMKVVAQLVSNITYIM